MVGEWPTMTLREANVTLIDCDHRTPPAAEAGYPYVAIPQLRAGRIDLSAVRRISRDHYIEWTRKAKPSPSDVVLSRRCNPGETAVVPTGLEFALGQNLVLLRADGTKVYPPFLRWLMRGPEWWWQVSKFINVGAVFDSLKCADVPNFELRIPPLREQRAIAHILGTLDDKVELNRRMNDTLEAMARALFNSWFVDFDPVRAKAEGRDSGLPKSVADLFPGSFEDSELGGIPKGWKASRLGEVLELKRGYDLPSVQRRPGTVPIVSSSGFSGTHDEEKAQAPGIVTGRYGTIGTVFFVRENFWPLNTTLYVRDFKGTNALFAYHLLQSVDFEKFSDKGAVPGINRNHLHEERVVSPPPAVQDRFGKLAGTWFDRKANSEKQAATLSCMREALLPKLISGELRVPSLRNLMMSGLGSGV